MKRRYAGHPMIKLAGAAARLPRYIKLAQAMARDSKVSRRGKLALGAGIGYAILPFDLVPGVIPIVGQLDDLAALLLSLRQALKSCPNEVAEAHLARVGLSPTALDHDLLIVRQVGGWLAKEGVALGVRALTAPLRLLGRGQKAQTRKTAEPV